MAYGLSLTAYQGFLGPCRRSLVGRPLRRTLVLDFVVQPTQNAPATTNPRPPIPTLTTLHFITILLTVIFAARYYAGEQKPG
jgi:hypothetical protein